MHFLKEIREHLKDFETEASDEMHKFIDFLHTKYQEPKPAVVEPPAPAVVPTPQSTFTAPVLDAIAQPAETTNVVDSDTTVSADPAPSVDTPVETAPTTVEAPAADATPAAPAEPTTGA
jgi:hypothetical protein